MAEDNKTEFEINTTPEKIPEWVEFFETVKAMRAGQKLYFESRNHEILKSCKYMEKKVDELLLKINNSVAAFKKE